jgi:hypothetical protein
VEAEGSEEAVTARRILRRVGDSRWGPILMLLVALGFAARGVNEWRNGQVSIYGPVGVALILIGVFCAFQWLRGLPKA